MIPWNNKLNRYYYAFKPAELKSLIQKSGFPIIKKLKAIIILHLSAMKKTKILDVQFDVCTKNEAIERIMDILENRAHESGKQIATPNPEMLLEAQKMRILKQF